jgi:GxxExxY protein
VTEGIIGRAFRVANALGHGFVEKVCENALAHEMRRSGLGVAPRRGNVVFGNDRMAEDQVIVEHKVAGALNDTHVPRC